MLAIKTPKFAAFEVCVEWAIDMEVLIPANWDICCHREIVHAWIALCGSTIPFNKRDILSPIFFKFWTGGGCPFHVYMISKIPYLMPKKGSNIQNIMQGV